MGMTGIESVGVHVPRYRISAEAIREGMGGFDAAGVSEKAVAGPDEDSLTMGVEAATRALAAADVDRGDLRTLTIGTTTPPLDENDLAAQVIEMMALPRDLETTVATQSTRAGTEALRAGARLGDGPALVIATDAPSGDPDDALGHAAGAGAVALVLTESGPATITDQGSYAEEFPGTRYRERGDATVQSYDATAYERHAYAATIAGAIDTVEEQPTALAPSAPDGGMPYRATSDLDTDPSVYERASSLGDTGSASPFFGLIEAWEDGESTVHVVGYGDGATADVLVIDGTVPVETAREPVSIGFGEYLRIRGEVISSGGGK